MDFIFRRKKLKYSIRIPLLVMILFVFITSFGYTAKTDWFAKGETEYKTDAIINCIVASAKCEKICPIKSLSKSKFASGPSFFFIASILPSVYFIKSFIFNSKILFISSLLFVSPNITANTGLFTKSIFL